MTQPYGPPPPPPPPLPPRTPMDFAPGGGRSSPRFDVFATGAHLFGWAVFAGVILLLTVFVVPRFEEVSRDFRIYLPTPTRVLLRVSRFFTHGGAERLLLLLLAPIPLVHALTVGVLYPRAGRGGRLVYRLMLTLILAAIALFVILALFLPQVALMEGLSGGSKK